MPAGQTPHTVILFAHNDLVDKVQPGDRVNVTGKNVGCIDGSKSVWLLVTLSSPLPSWEFIVLGLSPASAVLQVWRWWGVLLQSRSF